LYQETSPSPFYRFEDDAVRKSRSPSPSKSAVTISLTVSFVALLRKWFKFGPDFQELLYGKLKSSRIKTPIPVVTETAGKLTAKTSTRAKCNNVWRIVNSSINTT
jgi:hypothetical protein